MNIRPYYGRTISAFAAALVTLIALVVAYRFSPPLSWSAGEQDTLVFHGFNGLETSSSRPFRWSNGASTVRLPQVGQSTFGQFQLQLWGPGTQVPVPLTLTANRQCLLTTPVHGPRVLDVLIPNQVIAGGDLSIDLISPTWRPVNDQRELGVGVPAIGWHSNGTVLPPVQQLWVLPALALGLALLLARLGISSLSAGLSGATLGALLAAAAALRPLEVAPYTHRLLLMIVLAHLGLGLWVALLRAGRHWWHIPTLIEPLSFALLLGLGYWLMLPYQEALCTEMGGSVCPRAGTQAIGSAVFVLLLPLALLPALSQRLRQQLAIGVLALSGLAEGAYSAIFAFRRSGPDFFILWRAAYDFHLGRPLYKISDVLANHYGHVFKVPPFYGMLFLPFATANDIVVLAFHRGLNVILYLTTAALLVRLLRPRLGWLVAIGSVAVVMGLMQPPFDTIAYGQIDIMLLLLLTTALLALRSRRAWLAGAAIALGTLFKLYPAVLLGFLFVRREWKAFAWTFAALAVLNGIAIAVMGWPSHVMYVTQVLPNIGGGTSWIENQTINGFLSRLLTGTMRTDPIHSRSLDLLTYGIFAVVAGASLLLSMITFERRSSSFAVQFSIFTVVMVLVIPAAWMHYQTITILAFVALVWHTADHPFTRGKAILIAVAFGLIGYGNQWSFFDGTRHPGLPALALSAKCYGLVVLWGVMSYTIWHARALPRRSRQAVPAPNRALASQL